MWPAEKGVVRFRWSPVSTPCSCAMPAALSEFSMYTIALAAETVPRRWHSRMRFVLSTSLPQSSALIIKAPCGSCSPPCDLFMVSSEGMLTASGDFRPCVIFFNWFKSMPFWTESFCKEILQSLHLFSTAKGNQLLRDWASSANHGSPRIAGGQRYASNRQRRFRHLINNPKTFPGGMIAEVVILGPVPESGRQQMLLCRAHLAMM